MDWDNKFTSIVKDTETNLAKVKEHLGSSFVSSSALLNNGAADPTFLTRGGFSGTSSYHGNGISKLHSGSSNFDSNFGTKNTEYLPLDQSPGVVMVLQDRLDGQARAIDNLFRTVKRLEDEKDTYFRQVKDLRDELNKVTIRLAERGVDLHTERKLEQWRRDVASEMHSLQNQVQSYRGRDTEDNSGLSFSREAHEIRRFMQEECESFRREIDQFRHRLAKLEGTVTGMENDSRDIGRRHDRLDKNVRDMLDSQHLANQDLNRTRGDMNQDKEQLVELRNSYRSLRNKLGQIESHLSDESSNHGNKKSTESLNNFSRIPAVHRRPVRRLNAGRPPSAKVVTPTTSDLDLSTGSELDDLKDLKSPDLSLAENDVDLKIKDLDTDDDYLLTDLNLTTDILSSDAETCDLEDLQ